MEIYAERLPSLTTLQMIEVDRAMIEDFGIELMQMMENAGRNLADLARMRFLDSNPINKTVVILAGTGGNGGGALVCARRLHNWGAKVQVFVTKSVESFKPITAHQLEILYKMGITVNYATDIEQVKNCDLIIDGLIGYSLHGNPKGVAADLINWANHSNQPTLALDVPSGLDGTTGEIYHPAIKATATLTLALPKKGLQHSDAKPNVGELYLGDIGVPPALYAGARLGLKVGPIFAERDIVRLW